jgi:uncharacterized protein
MNNFPSKRLKYKKNNLFHNVIVFLDRLERVPLSIWIIFSACMLWAVISFWPGFHFPAYVITGGALAFECLVISASRWGERSPSPFGGPFFFFSIGHIGTSALPLFMGLPLFGMLVAHVLIQLILLWAMVYGAMVEPYRIRLRTENVKISGNENESLKIILLSDLHLDRACEREQKVLELIKDFGPDLILWPGDFTNLSFVEDKDTLSQTKTFIRELCDMAPLYVSRGTVEVDDLPWVEQLIKNTSAVLLENEGAFVDIKKSNLYLMGIPTELGKDEREESLDILTGGADDRPKILLYHTPDMIKEAANAGVDLYVAGHTHGGQIAMPLLGPLYTSSVYGRKYAYGAYLVEKTMMIVTRGIGMEGGGAPRIRFSCPPEVVGINLEISGKDD